MKNKKSVLVFIVSFNAEKFIKGVLERIPEAIWDQENYKADILIIDDQSSDETFYRAAKFKQSYPSRNIQVLYNPENQGYGGNQKLGYHFALKYNYDAVVLLHGDGQYAPEHLEDMIRPILEDRADVVLGSRMLNRWAALRGKMPLYKWVGNQILTLIQNQLLGSHLSEFHTGYRAYSTKALKSVPFELNSNYFDFDTDILIQMLDTGQRIAEIEIPTFYGDEISHVNGWYYALLIIFTTIRSRIVRLNLLYDRKFDYEISAYLRYGIKTDYPSSHTFGLKHIESGHKVLDLGCGPGYIAEAISEIGGKVLSIDKDITPATREFSHQAIEADLDELDFGILDPDVDIILMLDILESLKRPERLLEKIRERYGKKNPPKILITTGNVGFIIVRIGLLLGQFNYGRKGVLDRKNYRLFTFQSLEKLLETSGYRIERISAIPAPYPLAIRQNALSRTLIWLNVFLNRLAPGLFSYQMGVVAYPRPTLNYLLGLARQTSRNKMTGIAEPN